MDKFPKENDNTPPKKQSWGLATQAAMNFAKRIKEKKFFKK